MYWCIFNLHQVIDFHGESIEALKSLNLNNLYVRYVK